MTASPNAPKLSAHAKKLLKRLHEGRYYYIRAENTPKAMQELMEAGLVERGTRAPVLISCYVPKGTIPMVPEVIPPMPALD